MHHSLHPDELRGSRALWLLTVEALGRTWRFSSSPCVISDRSGAEWPRCRFHTDRSRTIANVLIKQTGEVKNWKK